MELRDYYRSFSDDELTRGAELYFAQELYDVEIKQNTRRSPSERFVYGGKKGSVSLCAHWNEHGKNKGTMLVKRSCKLVLDEESSLPEECGCMCREFEQNTYGCAHTAALLTAYMVKKNGEDVFAGSRLEQMLKDAANVEDPFAPGVLKRTDDRLLALLDDTLATTLPVWNENKAVHNVKDLLSAEFSFSHQEKGGVLTELKIGRSRKYVVKDIRELLDAYRFNRPYTMGKEEIKLSGFMCEPATKAVLDFLSSLVASKEQGLYSGKLFSEVHGYNDRYIILSGRELDTFMELMDGQMVTVNEIVGMIITLSRKGIRGILKKKAYGATFQVEPLTVIASTEKWLYVCDDRGVFRIGVNSTREVRELTTVFAWAEPVYIRESDVAKVIERFSPVFEAYGELITKGIDIESYEKEKPEFEFRLDYSSEGMLTCEPHAIYPLQDFRCLLFDDQSQKTRRNPEKETQIADILSLIFDHMDKDSRVLYSDLNEDELFHFMRDNLPEMEKLGTVLSTDSIKRNKVKYLPRVNAHVKINNGNLLLSLETPEINDTEMNGILNAYRLKKKYYRLKSGEFMSLEDNEDKTWDTLSDIYENYGEKKPSDIRLPLYRALYLQESLEKRDEVTLDTSDEYVELIKKMDPESVKELMVPKSLGKIVRPYQTEGFRWIKLLKNCGFGGILADDMGLGKTIQVLSFVLSEKSLGKKGDELRTLVVCPASLVYNWKREIETYTSKLTVSVVAGTVEDRKKLITKKNKSDIWITSYDLLKRDIEFYEGIHFANEIIDEAQYIKNQNTQASKSVRVVDSSFRLALTGTPIENHLGELWSIMDYLMPGFLYNYTGFQKNYEIPIVAAQDEEKKERLRRMVHPFILRRMKKQVLKELPDKMEESIVVGMSGEQRKLYDAAVKRLKDELNDVSGSEFRNNKMQFLARLTRLRELCCDPSLIYEGYKGESVKLAACLELVDQSINSGHKLLLFSQFTSMLDIICEALSKKGIEYHRIDGSVSKEKRMQMVDSFANDDVPVFCISLKAGGTGLNLTAADIVIHYDPWWNQAAQDQATDRTHRIGQTRVVNVYELIVQDTVEEQIQKIKEGKIKLADDILSGGDISSASFDKNEMLRLLS